MSLSDIAECRASLRVAGDEADAAIINYMGRYNLMIGLQTAERIKIQIGSVAPLSEEMKMEVKGRDMISGLPRQAVITSEEVRDALKEPVGQIIEAVLRTLESWSRSWPRTWWITAFTWRAAGRSCVGWTKVLAKASGLDVRVADDPLTCVARHERVSR